MEFTSQKVYENWITLSTSNDYQQKRAANKYLTSFKVNNSFKHKHRNLRI